MDVPAIPVVQLKEPKKNKNTQKKYAYWGEHTAFMMEQTRVQG